MTRRGYRRPEVRSGGSPPGPEHSPQSYTASLAVEEIKEQVEDRGHVSCTPEIPTEEPVLAFWEEGRRKDLSPSKASGKRAGDGEVSVAKVWARVGAGR